MQGPNKKFYKLLARNKSMLDESFGAGESGLEQRASGGNSQEEEFQQAIEASQQAIKDAKSAAQRKKATQLYVNLLKTGGKSEEHYSNTGYGSKIPYQKTGNSSGNRHGIYRGKSPQAPGKEKSGSGKPSE